MGFLHSKAENFKKMIQSYQPDDEVQKLISGFKEDSLISTIITYVVPVIASGTLEQTVTEIMSHLTVPAEQQKEVKTKLRLYLVMFNEVALA